MIRWIIRSSLGLRFLLIVLAAVLMVFGVVQLRSMPVDVYPEFNPPLVEVQTDALGLSAAEVEALLTVPLEADLLNGIAWLDDIYSESVAGMSSILLVFEEGTDPIRARLMVQERLTQTFALPNVSTPPTMIQPLSTTSRVMMVGISSDELSLLDLGVLARWNIKPRLMGVPGVANVAVWGHRDRQLQVLVDPARLEENGVDIQQIIKTTGETLWVSPLSYLESSTPGTDGWIDTPNQRISLRHQLPISSADELGNVPIEGADGLLLKDVADVVEDHQPLIGDASLNDTPGLMLVIEKFPGANTLEVTRGVEEALAAMAPGLNGVDIQGSVFRPASYIETAVSNISTAALIGGILLVIVLSLLFFNWRTALVSILVIPLSLILATYVLYLRGETFNVMILTGLVVALGVIIGNAVTDVEHIARRLRERREAGSDEPTMTIAYEAVLEMRDPLFFALLIILVVALPLFFIPGITGDFFQPLALSFVIALLVSLAVALTITPGLTLILLGDNPKLTPSPITEALRGIYTGLVGRVVHAPMIAIGIAVVMTILGLVLLVPQSVALEPEFQQSDILVEWEGAPGTSGAEMNRILGLASQELTALPGVRAVGSHIGRAIGGDNVVGINHGELWVSLHDNVNFVTTRADIEEVVSGYAGFLHTVDTYRPERTSQALARVQDQFTVRIYGHDLDVLSEKAEEVRQAAAGIAGVADARFIPIQKEPQLEIEVDLAAAEAHRIKPGDVRRQATTLISGLRVGNLYEENKVFDVVVWGVPEVRNDLTDINSLLITTEEGQVPLGELAKVHIAPAPTVIRRDIVSRFIDVTVDVNGDVDTVASAVRDAVRKLPFPLEYHAEILGGTNPAQGATQRTLYVAIAAVVGMLLLMQAAYRNWAIALVGVLTLPLALSGGVIASLLDGGVFSIGSLFGFYTIAAVALRSGMVMFSHFQNLEMNEGETFGADLVLRGASERMAAIVTTTLAIIVALLPFVFGGTIAGYEVLHSLAVVVIGGMITTLILTLFVLPALYLRFGSSPELDAMDMISEPVPAAMD